jgi:isopenicillin N synthase-like dioxygenase
MKPIIQTLDKLEFATNPRQAIAKLRNAFETTGFFCLKNHGMDVSKIMSGEHCFRQFLTLLPLQERLAYSYPEQGYQIGYTPPRIETGEFAKTPDEKHFFHVYPDDMPYVKELPFFKDETIDLWHEFNNLAEEIMTYIALSINKPSNFFKSPIDTKGYSLLRGIHYPAGQKPVDDDEAVTEGGNAVGMCASKHTDINMITLLLAKEPGLQLWHDGRWIPITISDPDLIIVNCGDMLQHLTNGIYRSGLHRVVCQENKERFSIPFFYHQPDDFSIYPLARFGEPKEQFHFKTAREFLHYRLRQLGLMM